MVKVVLAGGSGAIGRRLAADLVDRGVEVVVLTRRPRDDVPGRQRTWDGASVGPWASELAGAVVCNLAGELVDRAPTRSNIRLLRTSRVQPTRALVRAAAGLDDPPPVWLQMSTLAIHGDAGEVVLDGSSPPADGPPQMAGVARPWEQAAIDAPAERTVWLRTGVALDRGTPALDRLAQLTRFGLGGRVGSGRQWISWVHMADLIRAITFTMEHAQLRGPIAVTSPQPVRNAELMAELRRTLRRPPAPPTPTPLVHLGARLLGSDPALALTGRRAHPRELLAAGFGFRFPTLGPALDDLFRRP